ncbi:MAG TPA: hypothetical protein VFQ54_05080, partial [Thermomicrobiales bacterium]|nr:hypothetical protein [Thermomicrobiales bacterium]
MSAAITPTGIIQELVSLSGVGVSPDGAFITYVRTKYSKDSGKKESQVWIADIDGGNRRQLTYVGGANANPIWAPDSSKIAFTSSREGDKPGSIAILPIAAGGEAKVIQSHLATPVVLKWSPDGTKIAYTVAIDPENPNETPRDPKAPAKVRVVSQIDYKTDGIGYRGETRFQLFILDLETGESRQVTSGLRDILHPTWSPDGKTIAATVLDGAPHLSKLGLIDVA